MFRAEAKLEIVNAFIFFKEFVDKGEVGNYRLEVVNLS